MRKELRDRVIFLLAAIHDAGLDELVKDNHAFQTLNVIVKTGTSLPNRIKEPVDDTELCAQVMSNPMTWGIPGDAWLNFCEQWAMA